jgi:microcompartment protein CcmK/EutM
MKLGRVIGTAVSTRKDASLTSLKAIVNPFDIEGRSARLA